MLDMCDCLNDQSCACCAVIGVWGIVVGGHTAEAGWFRNRTDTYHNDTHVLDRSGVVQWRAVPVGGDLPAPRELHSLTALSGGRLLLFGGTAEGCVQCCLME